MFLPTEYQYFEPTLIAAAVVFVVGLIGNALSFSNRFANALVTAVVFAVIFGGLAFLSKGDVPTTAPHFLPAEYAWLELVLIGAGVVFFVDLIGNVLSFSSRIVNALVTAIVFAVIFGGLTYLAYKEGAPIPTISVPAPETPAPAPAPAPQ
jgi:hypothetical protein